MKRLAIIANPRSGSQNSWNELRQARRNIWGHHCEFFLPDSIEELREIVARLESPSRSPDYDGIVVVGGDGTQHQVIRSFKRFPNKIPLYPFPGGTANDLARELGLAHDWSQATRILNRGTPELIDLIEVNGLPFATVAGTGIGAALTGEFNLRRSGSAAFNWAARTLHSQIYTGLSLKAIFGQRDYLHNVHVWAPGFEERIEAVAIFVCNQAYLGGHLKVAPEIENDDNRFNVMIVPKCGRLRLACGLAALTLGKLPGECIIFSTDRLTLTETHGKPIAVFGDGETLVEASKLEFTINPRSLKVFKNRLRRPPVGAPNDVAAGNHKHAGGAAWSA